MSVLINGIKMPESCFDCGLYDDENSFCKAKAEFFTWTINSSSGRCTDCPLVEVPGCEDDGEDEAEGEE